MATWVNEDGKTVTFAAIYAGQVHPDPNDDVNPINTSNATGTTSEFSAEYRGANSGSGPGGVPGFPDPATGNWVEDWTGVVSMYGGAAQRGMDLGYLTPGGSAEGLSGGTSPYQNYGSVVPPAAQADPSHSWWGEQAAGAGQGVESTNFNVWSDQSLYTDRNAAGSPFMPHGQQIDDWERKVVGGADGMTVGSARGVQNQAMRDMGLDPDQYPAGVPFVAPVSGGNEQTMVADALEVITQEDSNAVDFFAETGTAQEWALKHFPWAKDLNLGAMIREAVTEGIDNDVLIAQVRDTPQYRATFPSITDEQGRMRFVDEQSYVDQVREYRNALIDAGSIGGKEIFNAATENPVDYATLMERGISTTELTSRLDTYRDLVNNSAHVRATFKTYANMDVSVDDLYQAVVDPEASKTLIGQYNQNLLDAEFDYSTWVANATEAALEATAETLNTLQAQGALPEGALARINSLSTEQAQGLVEALYLGDPDGDSFLELDELIEAFQFALVGGAAAEQGLVAPSMERVGEFRQAGIDRAKALKGYGSFVNQGSLIESMIRRTNVQGEGAATFGQEEFENAVFLSQAPETDLLTRARQGELARARTPGGFATTSRGARLAQPGRGATGVRS
jgi:hypothetical protein